MRTYHLHISGQVQGVGFRPFVYRLAGEWALNGWVNNSTDGVHIAINAERPVAESFLLAVQMEAPGLARITGATLQEIPFQPFDGFEIVHSDGSARPNLLVTPDFALCADCRRELHDPANRRYRYPFITCTNCGPRYSLITDLPYDRERTAMAPFTQCPVCRAEYDNPADRRYYSQTNSCPDCGIQLQWLDNTGHFAENPLVTAVNRLQQGKILGVKGIGGYLLVCDATNGDSIRLLRMRKYRPTKPFALLYPDAAMLAADTVLRPVELAALQSPEAPIVLLRCRSELPSGIQKEWIAPGLQEIGVMLPYAPLLELLSKDFGKPLIATSGNPSGSPIVFKDGKARTDLLKIADALLLHNREIEVPQDDSVLRFTPLFEQKIILRRSRGIAPYAEVFAVAESISSSVLAMGASLKSTFAWQHQGNVYTSQYLGDLESYDTQENFEHTLRHFLALFRAEPDLLVVDKHPDYFSTQLGKRLAAGMGIPVLEIQHHKAHFAAVLAENELLDAPEKILGVVWDGTGFGDDGQIWGGEFFTWDAQTMERVGHLAYFDFLLGDKMPREPRISALSLATGLPEADEILQHKFSATEWSLYKRLLEKGGLLQCSSMGRLFDGVASLLGLIDKASFEGEAAMALEAAAAKWLSRNGYDKFPPAQQFVWENGAVPTRDLVKYLLQLYVSGVETGEIAAIFHFQLIAIVREAANQFQCTAIACSGGVWQNALLTDLAIAHLGASFRLFFHQDLSPNDEGVSYGQLVLRQLTNAG